jgi:Fe/S biogenesis protein NfuA
MLTITELAREKILALMEAEDRDGLGLRVAIRGRGPGGFQYALGFIPEDEKRDDDKAVDAGEFKVFVDPQSAPNLAGSTLDYVEGVHGSGFKIDNPNPLWSDPLAQKVQDVIDQKVNPGVAGHGGQVWLLDVKDKVAYIRFGGGCQGCGMANVTLKEGIEVMIKEEVPEIERVIDSTDHADGKNPYYQPPGGGGSSCGG